MTRCATAYPHTQRTLLVRGAQIWNHGAKRSRHPEEMESIEIKNYKRGQGESFHAVDYPCLEARWYGGAISGRVFSILFASSNRSIPLAELNIVSYLLIMILGEPFP